MDKNEKWPKRYRAEFIEPGIISYEDIDQGKVFVSRDALNRMLESYIGKPVVNFLHQDLTPEQAYKLSDDDLESMADGVVYNVGKTDSGWYFCDMIIWDEETQKNIDNRDFSVSCAYTVDKVGPAGQYHGIEYEEEVADGTYTHMAIVDNPRYEEATITELPNSYQNSTADSLSKVLLNSKESNMGKIFKFFNKKKENEEKEEKDEVINMAKDAFIETENGEQVPISELIAAYKSKKENAGQHMNMEDEVDIDGEKVSVKKLYESYAAMKEEKENSEDPQDTVAEKSVDETLQNSKPEKKNESFKIIKNAASETGEVKMMINTRTERLKKGKAKYGNIKKEGVA